MGKSRLNKIARDLWDNRGRTFLVLLSMTIGISAVAFVADAYAILSREMNYNYLRTDPSSARLWVSPVDETTLARVQDIPGIAAADFRSTVEGRIQTGENEWKTIKLFVVHDFQNMPLDRIYSESGAWPPASDEILIERVAVRLFSARTGDTLQFTIPGGTGGELRYAGTAHAPGLPPAWMEGWLYGFITPSALERLGGTTELQELRVRFSDTSSDQEVVRSKTRALADTLRAEGYSVTSIRVPKPDQHPHATQMSTLLMMLQMFGLLALILSSVLSANMISAMMSREVRQIGVMKTLGAGPKQVAGLYFAMIGILGLLAMIVALPAALLAARQYAQFASNMLNFNVFRDDVPLPYWLLQMGLGGLLPLFVAAIPILRGSRISIRQAISDYGVNVREFGRGRFDRLLARLRALPRLALLAIRNTFRRRTRAIFTVLTLTAAGISFITAMNVSASMKGSVEDKFNAIRYDTMIVFNQPYPIERLRSGFAETPGLSQMEFWGGARAAVVRADGSIGNYFQLTAPNTDSKLMTDLPVAEGRWLLPSDQNALVVNQAVQSREPEAQVGATVRLRIDGRESDWTIVGIVWEMMAPPTAYTKRESFNHTTGLGDSAGIVVAQSVDRSQQGVAALTQSLEARMKTDNRDVSSVVQFANSRDKVVNHLRVLSSFLVIMSILVLIVGGLGLASTLSINVLERRREIGVLRATGASGLDVTGLVTGEGMMMGLMGWILAAIVAGPVGRRLAWNFGMNFFEVPLSFSYSVSGALLWLGVVIAFAAVASYLPALNASRLPVQKVLAYE